MDLINYDFESKLEQGFKTLFNTAGINLHIADDVDSDLPDENVRLDLSVGSVISNEHLKDSTIYDNYGGALEIEIQSPRVDDQVAKSIEVDVIVVSGAGEVNANGTYIAYQTPDEVKEYAKIGTIYSAGYANQTIVWDVASSAWHIYTITDAGPSDNVYRGSALANRNIDPNETETWQTVAGKTEPSPTVTRYTAPQFTSRHTELVATARKAIEEIDASVLATNWPGALSPTKIKPTGTERDNDAEHRVTKLSYDLQFRIT